MGSRGARCVRIAARAVLAAAMGLLVLIAAGVAVAQEAHPGDGRAAPAGEERIEAEVRAVARLLNCLVCPGQSVWESSSAWARARVQEIRAMVEAGMSREEILQAFVARYGSGILLAPPARGPFLAAWAVPPLALGAGLLALLAWWRRRGRPAAAGAPPAGDARGSGGG